MIDFIFMPSMLQYRDGPHMVKRAFSWDNVTKIDPAIAALIIIHGINLIAHYWINFSSYRSHFRGHLFPFYVYYCHLTPAVQAIMSSPKFGRQFAPLQHRPIALPFDKWL